MLRLLTYLSYGLQNFASTSEAVAESNISSLPSGETPDSYTPTSSPAEIGRSSFSETLASTDSVSNANTDNGSAETTSQQSDSHSQPEESRTNASGEGSRDLYSGAIPKTNTAGTHANATPTISASSGSAGLEEQAERRDIIYRSTSSMTDLTCVYQVKRDEYHADVLSLVSGEITRLSDSFKRQLQLHRENLMRDLSRHIQTSIPQEFLFTRYVESDYLQKTAIHLPESTKVNKASKQKVPPQSPPRKQPSHDRFRTESNGEPVDIWSTVENWGDSAESQTPAAQSPVSQPATSQPSTAYAWSLYPYGRQTRSQEARTRRFERYHQRIATNVSGSR